MLKGFVDRGALLREKLWTILSDVQAVFQTNSKLTVDHDRRFITETHARLNRRLVAAHEVCPLVPVETNAVSSAMWQAGDFVIRAKPCIRDHFSRSSINNLTSRTDFRRGKPGILRLSFEIPNLPLTIGGFAKHKGSSDV